MLSHKTKIVELNRGFVDEESGTQCRRVTLRVPMIEDEIRRDVVLSKLATSSDPLERAVAESDTMHVLALILEVVVEWENLPKPELRHIRSLTRSDASKLTQAFYELERDDMREQTDGDEGNESTDTPS